ncbi:MAG: aminotransferase class IV [Firmicutes bacterium]|jgi:branched-chain amino acid aminotransferase|nr:aminotransferase class IV [Bacillota bacterium]
MKRDIDCEYYLMDGEVKEFDCPNFDDGKRKIYEVIRLIDGKALFLNEHVERLNLSLEKIASSLKVNRELIICYLNTLTNGVPVNRNAKLVIIPYEDSLKIYTYYSKTSYPDQELYSLGVRTGLFKEVRENPNVKTLNMDYKKRLENFKNENGIYEAILTDNDDLVTEGSRSNLFFVKGNVVFTPKANKVLMGITRLKVIESISNLGLEYKEVDVSVDEISDFDGAFITGTSIGVMPVHSIDSIVLDSQVNDTIIKIGSEYERVVIEDIANL